MNKYLIALLLAGCVFTTKAQRTEIGVTGGGTFYMGDLNPEKLFELTQPAFGLVYRYNVHNRIALKGNFLYGTLKGDDLITQYRPERGLNFSTGVYEFSGLLEFNFFDYFTGSSRNYFTPYLFGGIGLFFYNPQATYGSTTYKLRELRTEGVDYSSFGTSLPAASVCIPFGIGFKYSLTDIIGLNMEWGMRKTMTDYIDDVHGVYPLSDAPLPEYVDPSQTYRQGMQRGNSKDNDWYSYAGLSIVFRINFQGKAKCDESHRIRF